MENMMTTALPASAVPSVFAFGGFVLEPARQALFLDGAPVRLGGRALEILHVLVRRAGELVSKRELLAQVWPDTVVEECNLKVQIAVLRKILAQGSALEPYIATVTGRGYRFVAPVRRLPPGRSRPTSGFIWVCFPPEAGRSIGAVPSPVHAPGKCAT